MNTCVRGDARGRCDKWCPNDTEPHPEDKEECENTTVTICVAEFEAVVDCMLANIVCDEDGKSDEYEMEMRCKSEQESYGRCRRDKDTSEDGF